MSVDLIFFNYDLISGTKLMFIKRICDQTRTAWAFNCDLKFTVTDTFTDTGR